jgi:hypothetical protein
VAVVDSLTVVSVEVGVEVVTDACVEVVVDACVEVVVDACVEVVVEVDVEHDANKIETAIKIPNPAYRTLLFISYSFFYCKYIDIMTID